MCEAHDSMSFVTILLFVVLRFFLGTLKLLTYAHAVCGRPTVKDAVERLFWPGLVRKLKENYIENKCVLNEQICENCGQFEKDASVSVVVNVENKESIND